MIITVTLDRLEKAAGGVTTTATGGLLPLGDALKLAERAHPVLGLFDHDWLRGPPAGMCAVHHVQEWRNSGYTDIDSLTLACDACHAQVHDGPTAWPTTSAPAGDTYAGRTEWLPPPHIDPARNPRINHRHHAGELIARARRNTRDRARTVDGVPSPCAAPHTVVSSAVAGANDGDGNSTVAGSCSETTT
ncbi:hypothetical protein OPAG_03276 [Rhodococcus opacus PD630]|nr:Uncharacterized protein Pd630_LPD02930 [Rhodococcus opacus PD630]EHI46475.1 hypothetical protein OPAG_03276 [Rhodococcus opacus PD630]KXF51807.1 hypothetical protein AXA44_12990 [Rhodococcus sp. SC4]PBC59125.1 HNH endonuclease [Rhodococcus sp. ACPA1]UDG99835.1 HNH endonuclease [Rhodococcus opacus PD630]